MGLGSWGLGFGNKVNDWVKSSRDLEVWQKGRYLVKAIYQVTARFPGTEKFGLVNQMRRAAIFIPSNIAEGRARSGTGEFRQFISIARSSVAELETQVILSTDLGFLNSDDSEDLLSQLDVLGKMLRGLNKSLTNRLS